MNYRSKYLNSRHGHHKFLVGQYVGARYIEKLRGIAHAFFKSKMMVLLFYLTICNLEISKMKKGERNTRLRL
jgi:hypothetical protein